MNVRTLFPACVTLLVLSACSNDASDTSAAGSTALDCPQANEAGVVNIAPGLTATISSKGYGRAAVAGDYADVHTTLWLYDENAEGGRGAEIWSSGGVEPFQFRLNAGQVIRGWDLGVECMLEGETRELKIAPELGYGERAAVRNRTRQADELRRDRY